jgi:alanine racemase
MSWSRRSFVSTSAAALTASPVVLAGRSRSGTRESTAPSAFEPSLEIDAVALAANAREAARLARERPIIAVVKNNAYGLGTSLVGEVLQAVDEIAACAVVTPGAAHELRDAGFSKPVLLMARVDDDEGEALIRRGVRLTTADAAAAEQLSRLAGRVGSPARVHAYIDTGMSRLGVPFRKAARFLSELAADPFVSVDGVFMGFSEDDDFDVVQLDRLRRIRAVLSDARVPTGAWHAASSHALFFRPEAHLDMVRPGLAIFGAYPAGAREEGTAALVPAFRLRARVARVERLEEGDGVSYGQNYIAERPTWVATLPVGHADGYPRRAVDGCEVLIGGRTYPVIGAVSASHTILEIGDEPRVAVGDEAVLVGPDDPAVHPNEVARLAGISVYDVLMHLSARLPRTIA